MTKPLAKFTQIVVFLFAAFGGFLKEIAPPTQPKPKLVVGLGSFLVLIILLIVSALARNNTSKTGNKRWVLVGCICFVVALVSGMLYPWTLSKLTYFFPPAPLAAKEWKVNGLELTQTARDFIEREPGNYTPAQLNVNLNYEDIWTESSLMRARLMLLSNYLCLVLSISTAIFCLLEANSKNRDLPLQVKRSRTKNKHSSKKMEN